MKRKLISRGPALVVALAFVIGLASPVWADTGPDIKIVKDKDNDDDTVIVRSVERTRRDKKDVSWLGVAVEEAPEALAAQLDLKQGEGLVVTMVASNSPAATADLHRFDVLVEFEGQMLVDPEQLRKLVRMHPQGDVINLTLYRGGKKISVSAKLGQTRLESASLDDDEAGANNLSLDESELNQVKARLGPLRLHQKELKKELENVGEEKEQAEAEVQRSMREVKRTLERMMKDHPRMNVLATADNDIATMADNGVALDKDASVVVRKDLNSAKSILKTDDSGVYIIIEDPKKHLTAHDRDGKLLFDGDIETPEEQQKVPRAVWEKVKPMVDQLGNVIDFKPQSKTNIFRGANARGGTPHAPSSSWER